MGWCCVCQNSPCLSYFLPACCSVYFGKLFQHLILRSGSWDLIVNLQFCLNFYPIDFGPSATEEEEALGRSVISLFSPNCWGNLVDLRANGQWLILGLIIFEQY